MATLEELHAIYGRGLITHGVLFNRVQSAVLLIAFEIQNEAPATELHAARLAWTKTAYTQPGARAEEMWGVILAANAAFTPAQILGATDAAVLTAARNAVNVFLAVPTPPVV